MVMRLSPRAAANRALYGRAIVACEECGTTLPAHLATWRGLHAYCSAEHDDRDGSSSEAG